MSDHKSCILHKKYKKQIIQQTLARLGMLEISRDWAKNNQDRAKQILTTAPADLIPSTLF